MDLSGIGVSVALTVGAIALMLLLEPLCLHYFGTTPGKALLGLYVERPDGGRLSLGEAARRTFDVLTYGLGFHVPILSLVLLIRSWLRHRDGRPLRWEEGSELRLRACCEKASAAATQERSQLGRMLQMPQGQTPAQIPQPMQRAGSETYSKPPLSALRSMAFSGQDLRHILQSRQVPQLTQRA